MKKFLQIHTLTSYPASLLNRDDAGFAKRIPFGGVTRTRISSQCLKRHWRTFAGTGGLHEIGVPASLRSRITFQECVLKPLVDKYHVDDELAGVLTAGLQAIVLGGKKKADDSDGGTESGGKGGKKGAKKAAKKKSESGGDDEADLSAAESNSHTIADVAKSSTGKTDQVTVIGPAEIEYVLAEAVRLATEFKTADAARKGLETITKAKEHKEWIKNLAAISSGLDAALFGRMITGDVLATMNAAVHVAHAFTVHAEQSEPDYFSAVDELLESSGGDARGSGHINTAELTSGLYYGYVAVDVNLLRENVIGMRKPDGSHPEDTAVREVLRRLVGLIATVTPGAKLGATAPHARAQLVLLEAGNAQPRTLANAFLAPVEAGRSDPNLLDHTCSSMSAHVSELDGMYPGEFERRWAGAGINKALTDTLGATQRGSVPALQEFAATVV